MTLAYGDKRAKTRDPHVDRVTLDERLDDLSRRGALVPASAPGRRLQAAESRPGALERFLAERGR